MGKQRPGTEIAKRLEDIAAIDPQHYVAHVCKGVTLGLRGKLKDGLAELEQAIPPDLGGAGGMPTSGKVCYAPTFILGETWRRRRLWRWRWRWICRRCC